MLEPFKIWIDRLTDGKSEKICAQVNPNFLEIEEKELQFSAPVQIEGKAYLADQELIIHLAASGVALMPCSICNEMTSICIRIENFYHAESLESIKGAVFDFSIPLREALLLELPNYVECNGGHCPQRNLITPYLKSEKKSTPDVHFPFAKLE